MGVPGQVAVLTPWLDLRGGVDCWQDEPETSRQAALPEHRVDLAIIGAGVTGAILADHFQAQGHEVLVLDRRRPATGATAASTALVLWAPDTPLIEHSSNLGASAAERRWRGVYDAVQSLDVRVRELRLDCGWSQRPDLYLAGDRLDAEGLKREAAARRSAGLPSTWVTGAETQARFGVQAAAAMASDGAFLVDPVALTRGLLNAAQAAGARLCYPAEALGLKEGDEDVEIMLDGARRATARHVILATGYETAGDLPAGFGLGSSFAIASPPGQPAAWGEDAMIWEASDPYLYFRTTADGRIVVGGEDEAFYAPARRDALIGAKAQRLLEKLRTRLPSSDFTIDCAWAATFGVSKDSLPAIGLRSGHARTFVAHSFGGNGVAFAALAAALLGDALAGRSNPLAQAFRPDRHG